MVRTPTQRFALRTDQVVAPIFEPALGNHVGRLVGMDWDVGGDVMFFQQIGKPTIAVAGVTSQRHRLQRETIQ